MGDPLFEAGKDGGQSKLGAMEVEDEETGRAKPQLAGATPRTMFLALLKNIIGSGMVTLPLAALQTGLVPFFLLMLVVGYLSIYCFLLVCRSFETLVEAKARRVFAQHAVEVRHHKEREALARLPTTALPEVLEALSIDAKHQAAAPADPTEEQFVRYVRSVPVDWSLRDGWASVVHAKTWWFPDVCILTLTIMTNTSYTLLLYHFGKNIAGNVLGWPALENKWVLVTGAMVVLNILVLPESIAALRYTSLVGNAFLVYIITAIVWRGAEMWQNPPDAITESHKSAEAFAPWSIAYCGSIAIYASSFICHYNAAAMYGELRDRSIRRWKPVVYTAFLASAAVYLVVGLMGYLPFTDLLGRKVFKGNILNVMFEYDVAKRIWVDIASCLYLFMVTFTFPLVFTSMRRSTLRLLKSVSCLAQDASATKWRYYIVTEAYILILWAITIGNPDLGAIVKLKGASVAPLIMAIIPCVLFLRAHPKRSTSDTVQCYICIVFAAVTGLVALVDAIWQFIPEST